MPLLFAKRIIDHCEIASMIVVKKHEQILLQVICKNTKSNLSVIMQSPVAVVNVITKTTKHLPASSHSNGTNLWKSTFSKKNLVLQFARGLGTSC